MKNLKLIFGFLFASTLLMMSCQEDDPSIGEIIAPTNVVVTSQIVGQDADNPYGDGSGAINFSASADNAIAYKFVTTGGQQVSPSGNAQITFTSLGVNTYDVAVAAIGTGGVTTTITVQVEVLVTYAPPADLLEKLVGDGTKTWRIKSEKNKHFGLAAPSGNIPFDYYGAGPEEKAGVGMYDDRYVFNADGTFTHITNNTNDSPTTNTDGTVFGRSPLILELGGIGGGEPQGADILNYPLSDYSANWGLIAPAGVETLTLNGTGFIGYYTGGNHQYRIFDRSVSNEMTITTNDGNGEFSWWFIITSQEPGVEEGFTTIYNDLLWEDNFDTDGAPNPANWTYDLGAGGWGNNELQTYTNNADNVIVEGGFLKITARANGGSYTSARLKSENLFEFTNGRVEVRAKLPAGIGAWPAIWMLGADYNVNPWPGCGEIDIMEQTGQDKTRTLGTLHYPGVSPGGGNSASTAVPTSTTAFHNYTVEWTPDLITLLVDNNVFHTVPNSVATPFNSDFFMILNIAMGGSLGGTVDPAFTTSSMEIDYVRVYQ